MTSVAMRIRVTWLIFGSTAVLTCLLAPLIGSTPISIARVFDRSGGFAENLDAQIFFVARLPRVLAGALVGSALMSEALRWAERVGVERVALSVYPGNEAALALYRKFGFEDEGVLRRHAKKPYGYEDEVVMARFLR